MTSRKVRTSLINLVIVGLLGMSLSAIAQEKFSGTVVDEFQNPLVTTLSVNGYTTTSQSNGTFSITVPKAPTYVMNAGALPYAPYSQVLTKGSGGFVVQLRQADVFVFNPNQGIDAIDRDGTELNIAANSVVDQNGNLATTQLILYLTSYTPQNMIGGDMNAINLMGQPRWLLSLGAAWFQIRDQAGNRYSLAPGLTARLAMPLPQGVQFSGQVPMWNYNPTTGMWRQAPVNGQTSSADGRGVSTAMVGSDDFWNFDIEKQEPACVKINVEAEEDKCVKIIVPLPYNRESTRPIEANSTLTLYNLPANTPVEIWVADDCNGPWTLLTTVNTGAPWGGTGSPSDPDDCNGQATVF